MRQYNYVVRLTDSPVMIEGQISGKSKNGALVSLLKTIIREYHIKKNEINVLEFGNEIVNGERIEHVSVNVVDEFENEWSDEFEIKQLTGRY